MLLNDLAQKYGSDKMLSKHGYVQQYTHHFESIKDEPLKILELGVREGYSLLMWHDYFLNAQIYGIDNNAEGKCPKFFDQERITFEIGNQDDELFLSNFNKKFGPFDIIIDDCSHISPLTIRSFEILFPLLKEGGTYVIEDLHACDYGSHYLPYGPSTKEYLTNIPGVLVYQDKIAFIGK